MPASCKQNITVINALKTAIPKNPQYIKYVDSDLLANKEFLTLDLALVIVKEDPFSLRYLPDWCKHDEQILETIKTAIPKINLEKIHLLLDTYDLSNHAVAKSLVLEILYCRYINLSALPGWCKKDKDIVKLALEKNLESIKDIDPKYTILGGNEKNVSFVAQNDKAWLKSGTDEIKQNLETMKRSGGIIVNAYSLYLDRKRTGTSVNASPSNPKPKTF